MDGRDGAGQTKLLLDQKCDVLLIQAERATVKQLVVPGT